MVSLGLRTILLSPCGGKTAPAKIYEGRSLVRCQTNKYKATQRKIYIHSREAVLDLHTVLYLNTDISHARYSSLSHVNGLPVRPGSHDQKHNKMLSLGLSTAVTLASGTEMLLYLTICIAPPCI